MKTRIIIFSVAALLLVSFAFVKFYLNGAADLASIPELEKRFNEYYQLEKSHNWGKAYSYRTPIIQKTLDKNYYISRMQKDSKGWKLINYKIRRIEKNNNKIEISVDFKESPSNDFLEKIKVKDADTRNLFKSGMIYADRSVWKLIEGKWYCEEAGSRAHLPLNGALAIKN